MRRATHTLLLALLPPAALFAPSSATAQMDLSGIKIAEPSPELPGDRALGCTQIAVEMGEIMRKRDMKRGIASAQSKICGSKQVLDQQGEERKKMLTAQMPQLTAAAAVGGPVANAVVRKTQAEEAALEAKQRPGRDRAMAGIGSGIGDMMGVMNDPRLMRLSMLAQQQHCGENMAPARQPPDTSKGDGCGDADDTAARAQDISTRAEAPPAVADPFVKSGAAPAKAAAQDPFAQRP